MEVSGTQARYNPSPAGSGKCIGKGKANDAAYSCLAACNHGGESLMEPPGRVAGIH